MGLTQSFSGFLVVRFFLGITESGIFPGAAFYLGMWYKRNERHYRIALMISDVTLAGAFSGLFVRRSHFASNKPLTKFQAYALAKMKGIAGLGGWRRIFIIVNISSPILDIEANMSF
jgi:MFS family permease